MGTYSLDRAGTDVGYRRLIRLVRDVVAEQAVESVVASTVETLRALVWCDIAVVWVPEGEDELAVALADGEDMEELRGMRVRFGQGLTGLAARERETVIANDAHLDERAGLVPGTADRPEAIVCVPLVARNRLLGVLGLYRTGDDRHFDEQDIELVADFASVVALALDNAHTRAELERLAQTDDLTDLPNRRTFRPALEAAIAAARATRSPLSLLLLDLDDFKAVNDTYGHARGDSALRIVADTINAHLRPCDLAARVGGDEFVIMLPDTTRAHAHALAGVIADSVTASLAHLAVGASIGVSTLREQEHDLLEEADQLLYQAKRAHPTPDAVRLTDPTPDAP